MRTLLSTTSRGRGGEGGERLSAGFPVVRGEKGRRGRQEHGILFFVRVIDRGGGGGGEVAMGLGRTSCDRVTCLRAHGRGSRM